MTADSLQFSNNSLTCQLTCTAHFRRRHLAPTFMAHYCFATCLNLHNVLAALSAECKTRGRVQGRGEELPLHLQLGTGWAPCIRLGRLSRP